MSREKQIEEMANTINEMDEPNAHYYGRNMKEHEAFADCFTIARHLYDKGYRKQIKAEWKYGKENGQYGYYCTNCKVGFVGENAEWIAKEHDYCPRCGAYMKGGAE